MNQEKFWSLKVRDDVTCFSRGGCDVVGGLVETALQPWSFAWKVLVSRVSPDARVTLSRKIPGRFTGGSYDRALSLLAPSQG